MERQKSEKEEQAKKTQLRVKPRATRPVVAEDAEDVFGLCVSPTKSQAPKSPKTQEYAEIQAQILSLRKRLRSLSINGIAHPSSSSSSSAQLPTQDQTKKLAAEFLEITREVGRLPPSTGDQSVDVELRSLRVEIEASTELLQQIHKLAALTDAIQSCDAALSDLLEHVDSYPSPPLGLTTSSHIPTLSLPPEGQLSSRISFTKSAVDHMSEKFSHVANDARAITEQKRILQTWEELEDMSNDRIQGKKSRPGSVLSTGPNHSGRDSRASVVGTQPAARRKAAYSNLSLGSSTRGRLHVPAHPSTRRSVSGSEDPHKRPFSQMSNASSSRSVSGPLNYATSSSLFSSTFASRQRTSSLSSNAANITPAKKPALSPLRPRAQTGQTKRSGSPTQSETSSLSRSVNHSRPTASTSTWARAPRNSLTSLPQFSTPPRRKPTPKKTYIADPNSKLDVAVGDVVNKLPVNINVEVVAETWKDQSGKYWIGEDEPKLCFCRILRSRTVMVRVGGGWTELSKFIKDHFADLFHLIPESPPRLGTQEEKWINSTTLLEAPEITETPPPPPRTPEPKFPFLPSFSLSTPSGQSPRSIKSASPGSPLVPLQFIRRADLDPSLARPSTPSKSSSNSTLRPRMPVPAHSSSRNFVWRP
jgi:hypothetical protein